MAFTGGSAQAQLLDRKVISLGEAQKIAAAARAAAMQAGLQMAVAVVDANGELILLERMDDVQIGSIQIAQGKARTSALLRRPTVELETAVAGGRNALISLDPRFVLIGGGLNVVVDGQTVGAVGCSGGTAEQDAMICQAGLAARTTP